MKLLNCFVLTIGAILLSSQLASADIGNTATQQMCTQSGSDSAPLPPNPNTDWANGGLNRNLDRIVYKREIIAYKIKWSSGWSVWYVKGVNDLYSLTTPSASPPGAVNARLAWIYFVDHQHQFISCD
ncbi:hypothetical protein RIF25_03025 [Thermosynechococcaceae cyanobacterium BACA0444]|uniref:Uncharacterized protein n=1 Tax=Pseudocalidococcus azoricus BACA0444 TaxID=2918990 RepID=A0AAE4FPL5_9CYAN|nr:hypothetical protein [Pseudocalidococcus azoricus]MDS3859775.1 hypothetical protein [Pseudocalidococcus azoricus BACA0444]